MARVAKNRSSDIPYRPGFPTGIGATPEQIVRALWEELTRISIALAGLDQPMGASVTGSESVSISVAPTLVWTRLFDGTVTSSWVRPADAMNAATGVYTIAQEGVYKLFVEMIAPAFATPANKAYYGGIRITLTFADGSPSKVITTFNGGYDSVPLTVFGSYLGPLTLGDKISVDASLDHQSNTGAVVVTSFFQIQRVSGARNNLE